MDRTLVAVLAFAAGAAAGALAVRWYIQSYPLQALGPGAASALVTRLGGTPQEASAAAGLVSGLVTPNG